MKEKKTAKKALIKKIIIYTLVGLLAAWIIAEDIKQKRQWEAELETSIPEENNVREAAAEQEIVEPQRVEPGERDVKITEFYIDTVIRKHNDKTYEGKNDYKDTQIIVGAIGVDEDGNEIYLDKDEVEQFQTDDIALYLTSENIGIQVGDVIKVALDEYGDIIYTNK
jgi:cytoskeletal protein RodZ